MASRTSQSFDPTDHAILAILQADGRLGVTEIGRRVNLSQPAVSARIKRLEQAGVITGYRAVIDPARNTPGRRDSRRAESRRIRPSGTPGA